MVDPGAVAVARPEPDSEPRAGAGSSADDHSNPPKGLH